MLRRRPIARAAVVGGLAYGAGKNAANNAAQDQAQSQAIQQQQADIDALAAQNAALQQQMAAQQAQQPAQQQPAAPQPLSQAEELAKLAKMFQDGLINEQEYNAAKAKVLGI